MVAVAAAGQRDYPGRRMGLAGVVEQVQTVIETSPDVTAVVVFQDDVERRAYVGDGVRQGASLRRDRFDLGACAHLAQTVHHFRPRVSVTAEVAIGRRHHPVADGREDGARLEALRRALREHARYRRHDKLDVRMRAHDGVTLAALQGDRVPGGLERVVCCFPPDHTEGPHQVAPADDRRDEISTEGRLQHWTLQVVEWVATRTL